MIPLLLPLLLQAPSAAPPPVTAGEVVASVTCVSDASQSYAVFVPREYTPDRAWPVIFAFDPGARGRTPVDRYQAAAAQYGFIVAGSNNSRNGILNVSQAINAMVNDVTSRWHVDPKRVYFAGMSGGARVALGAALSVAVPVGGVIASSAGYPDSRPRKTLPFPVFATAGTEDFNHLEMRRLDAALTTPHHLAIFEGGHTWLSSDLAIEAVEWMEIQSMKLGVRARDEAEIDRIFAKRRARVTGAPATAETLVELQSLVSDFNGLRDVSSFSARAAELERDKGVRAALKKARDEDDREETMLIDVKTLESRLANPDEHLSALADLRTAWQDLSQKASKPADSPERRLARRVLSALSAGATTTDPEYLKIIAQYRMTGRRGMD
jgi:predicted esterase